ncbi:amidase family protein [Levilactobacillus enshiensis]|uniref:amidase family protein n=1 Tax=Levilactobacillus enshiensis TaxID=2590213 RepID=UPI001CDCE4CE|nr:amidase family protein [Levilactobacillus enshiensis]
MKQIRFSHWLKTKAVLAAVVAATMVGGAVTGVAASETSVHSTSNNATVTATTNSPLTLSQYEHATATQLAQMVRDGKVTSQQLVQLAMTKVKQDNPQLNAVITMREAKAMDEAAALKDTGQPFYGVPILIKGLAQELKGESATQGLPYSSTRVASYTKPFVLQLQSLGFIVIGQTNYPELGLTNVTTSKLYGAAANPWNTADNPGGSSGGAAASVADDMVPLATGNDAGGSLRIPASWSGVIGLKPSAGMIKGDSVASTMASFAETKSMADTQTLFDNMLSGSVTAEAAPKDLKSVTIAYSTKSPVGTPVSQDAVNAVTQAVSFLKSQGFNVQQVDSPVDGKALMQAYYKGATTSGFAANSFARSAYKRDLLPDDGSIMTYALYQASKKLTAPDRASYASVVATAKQQMADFHQKYGLYLTPTTATTAPSNSDPAYLPEYVAKLRDIASLDSKDQMQLIYDAWLHGLSKTPFTQLANVTGEPAISLPTYVSASRMPLGIQLEAAKNQDHLLLAMGDLFESKNQLKFRDSQSTDENTGNTTGTTTAPATPEASTSSESKPATSASKPTTPATPVTTAQAPKLIYAKGALNLYRDVNLTQRVRHYTAKPRIHSRTFKTLGVAYAKNGALRYRVKGGYITANSKFVAALYYQQNPQRVRVIGQHGIYSYRQLTFKSSQRVRLIKKGKVLKIKAIRFHGQTARLELTNGQFITANKQFVIQNKS